MTRPGFHSKKVEKKTSRKLIFFFSCALVVFCFFLSSSPRSPTFLSSHPSSWIVTLLLFFYSLSPRNRPVLLSPTHTRTTPEPTTEPTTKRTQFGSKRGTAAPPDSALFLSLYTSHTHPHTTHLYSSRDKKDPVSPLTTALLISFSPFWSRVRFLRSLFNCAKCLSCPRPPCDRHLRPSDV